MVAPGVAPPPFLPLGVMMGFVLIILGVGVLLNGEPDLHALGYMLIILGFLSDD